MKHDLLETVYLCDGLSHDLANGFGCDGEDGTWYSLSFDAVDGIHAHINIWQHHTITSASLSRNCVVLPYIYMCVIPLLQCPETVGDLLLNYSVEYII